MAHVLAAGHRLEINQTLVSANGRFTLLMQNDGNLALYQDEIGVKNAYWSTKTNWLPNDKRPTYAEMQEDANFVLYDANKIARWASGTWGPAFVEPTLVLRDDGSLAVLHHGEQGEPIWSTGIPGGVGKIPPLGQVRAPEDLNFGVDRCGRMPLVVSGSTDLAPPFPTTVDAGGVAYTVVSQRRRLVNDVIEQAFLQDIAAMGVWPGQVIQGRALLVGDVAPIGPLPRQPGTIELATDVITNAPQRQSAEVDSPDAAKVNQLRQDILRALNPVDSPGLLKTDYQQASTFREAGVKLGVTVKGAAFGVDANAALNETRRQSTVVAAIRQIFYTVTFTPKSPQATGIWPGGAGKQRGGVTFKDLQPFAGPGNPPLYIDSVQYGRFICVTATGAFSSSDLSAALKASWTAMVSGNVEVDVRTREVLQSSQVKIYTLGVPGHQNFQDLADPIGQLKDVYRSGLSLTLQNPGAPISFTCRHVADGTLAHVGLAGEYIQPLSAQGENVSNREFQVFDGPGGGLVDTQIRVNPGDRVTVHAKEKIWSGVWFSGDHGPEGWPGHRADPHAPLPQGTAYAHIIRFGNGPWIEAGPRWEGSPDQAGALQLHVNDNNPYNGDPRKRWRVFVDVQRAGAAAVGVFI